MCPDPAGQTRLSIELRAGFANHTVAVIVDHQEVFHRSGVTTDPASDRAAALDVATLPGVVWLTVVVSPGERIASLDVDAGKHRHVSISLIGTGTISVEVTPGAPPAV